MTTGEGIRVPAGDILEIGIEPPRLGRLSLMLQYRTGLGKAKTSYWVEPEHEADLQELVEAIRAERA